MLSCLVTEGSTPARPIWTVPASGYEAWLAAQPARVRAWLEGSGFEAKPAACALLPEPEGHPRARS